ncbi:hypothetical protein [Halovulum sp. GXIMD14793]
MKIILRAGLVLATVALGACTAGSSASPTGTTKIDQRFQVDGINIGRGKADIILLFAARENNGMVEVCGAIKTFGPALYQSGEPQVLRGNYLKIGNTTIANSLSYFARLPRGTGEPTLKDVAGKSANCATTGAVWQPGYDKAEIKMVLRANSVQL